MLQLVDFLRSLRPFLSFFLIFSVLSASSTETERPINSEVVSRLREHIHFDPKGPNVVGHFLIDDRQSGINQATWLYIKKGMDYYKKHPPIFVILELNTPGGEVYPAQLISDALKELDTQYNVPVVAYINNWAISAGAMLAYSARFISVVKDGSMGAAEPVIAGEQGAMVSASEKVNSALRADFANRAGFFDRNPNIAIAMVDKDTILVWRDSKVVKLDREDQVRRQEPNPDLVISSKGKLLTLSAKQLIEFGVVDILVPPIKTGVITEEEINAGKWPGDKMAIFHLPFFNEIPDVEVDSFQMDLKTKFLSFLSHPIVSSLLLLGLMMSFYIELNTGGFGLAASIGLVCLFLIFLSSFSLQVASILEVVLFLVGLGFVVLDLLFIPTFGFLGIAGAVLALIGLFGMMLPGIGSVSFDFDTKTFNAAGEVFIKHLTWLLCTLALGIGLIIFLSRHLMPSFEPFRRFVLKGNEEKGNVASELSLPQPGKKGKVWATLRPSGKVMVDGIIYDAVSKGDFIERGAEVTVVDLDESVVVVEG